MAMLLLTQPSMKLAPTGGILLNLLLIGTRQALFLKS